MNKNKIVAFNTKKTKGLFISVPYDLMVYKCEFGNLETIKIFRKVKNYKNEMIDSINRITIPKGYNKILGLSNKLTEIQMINDLGLTYHEYLKFLEKKDISVNYSDFSNCWLIVVLDLNNECHGQ